MNWKLKTQIVEKFGSQADFAMKIEKAESFVSRIVRQRSELPPEGQKEWAEVLQVNPDEIFGTGRE